MVNTVVNFKQLAQLHVRAIFMARMKGEERTVLWAHKIVLTNMTGEWTRVYLLPYLPSCLDYLKAKDAVLLY